MERCAVYKLVDQILLEQSHTENILNQLNAGRVTTEKSAKYVRYLAI